MSKKNSKSMRRQVHATDLKKEREEQEKRAALAQKKSYKLLAAKGVEKQQKGRKLVRIRKGVRVKGIQITDSSSKRKVRKLLAAEAAMRMAVDEEEKAPAKSRPKKLAVKLKRPAAAQGGAAKGASAPAKEAAAGESMVIG